MPMDRATIAVDRRTRNALGCLRTDGETYNDVILRVMKTAGLVAEDLLLPAELAAEERPDDSLVNGNRD